MKQFKVIYKMNGVEHTMNMSGKTKADVKKRLKTLKFCEEKDIVKISVAS